MILLNGVQVCSIHDIKCSGKDFSSKIQRSNYVTFELTNVYVNMLNIQYTKGLLYKQYIKGSWDRFTKIKSS